LDGVVCGLIKTRTQDRINGISSIIKESKQFSQLHAVILTNTESISDRELDQLAEAVKNPVMALTNKRPVKKLQHKVRGFDLKVNGTRMSVLAASVEKEEAKEILGIGSKPGEKTPEVTRIADLIMNELRLTQFQALRPVKGR
jgi:endonuclease V-like protein UPF0215 family